MSNVINIQRHEHEGTIDTINQLFSDLRGMCPAFKQAWPTTSEFNAAKKLWLKAFVLAGINRIEQIEHGLKKCLMMGNAFVPTPGEFIAWCKPSMQDLGFPAAERAFPISIVMNQQFSDYKHPDERVDVVMRHAIANIGHVHYRVMTTESAKKCFAIHYADAFQQFLDGELKITHKSITEKPMPHPSDKQRNDEARRRAMEEFRKMGINIKTA